MNTARRSSPLTPFLLAAILVGTAAGPTAAAEETATATAAKPGSAPAPASGGFSQEQLEQLVAPIALYPDGLLSQILMASTYPLEIVEAQRWTEKNPGLTGDALEKALQEEDWDASVKSLCGFPDVIKTMAENLDWTQDLGDAFLGQKAQLMDSVQVMRGKAHDEGNLKSDEHIQVEQQPDKIIVIQPSNPEVIYVPSYSPTVVYGPPVYPSYYYPSFYYPPPPGYGLMAFTVGVAWGAAIWGDCHWGWGHSDVDIDINRQNNFNRETNIGGGNRVSSRDGGAGGRESWTHDPSHRKGVNYRDSQTAQRFGGSGNSSRVTRDQARGRSPSAAARPSSGGLTARTPSSGARGDGQRPSTAGGSGSGQRPSGGSARPSASAGSTRGSSPSSSVYSGSRSSSGFDRSASSRGASSRGSTSYGGSRGSSGFGGSGGGLSRGGGGRRR